MRRKTKFLFLLIPLFALTACATNYQKEGIFSNGYSDFRLGEDKFVVTFRANEYTQSEKVMKYALKRASELALQNGYRYYVVLDEIDTSKERTVVERIRDGSVDKSVLSHLHYPSLRLTIQCFSQKPFDKDAIDAQHFLAFNHV